MASSSSSDDGVLMNRYELQSRHAGVVWLVIAIYASSDQDAIVEVAEAAEAAMKGATDLKLYEISIGTERLVKDYIGGEVK